MIYSFPFFISGIKEEKFGFKPTYLTLVFILTNSRRLPVLKLILKVSNTHYFEFRNVDHGNNFEFSDVDHGDN